MRRALLLAVVVLVGGCGEDGSTGTSATDTITLPAASAVKVYWLRDGKVWPVARELQASGVQQAALDELAGGPTAEEQKQLGATSAIPDGTELGELDVSADGVVSVTPSSELSDEALAQVVYTLTGFSAAESVEIGGKRFTRANFEEQTPTVLVESPLPFEEVTTPLRVTGTANTFEATFDYELLDADGKVVDGNFVTATSGTGTRGTFDFTTKAVEDVAALRVFEISAENGSRVREVEIPLRTSQ